jgi:hypothetical protein
MESHTHRNSPIHRPHQQNSVSYTKCPFNLTAIYLSSDLKATGMLLIGPPPIRFAPTARALDWLEDVRTRGRQAPLRIARPVNPRALDRSTSLRCLRHSPDHDGQTLSL